MTSGGGPEGYCRKCGAYSQSRSIKFEGLCMACNSKEQKVIRQAPVIEDGFGNAWANWCHECEKCSLEVVRPGKVQCGICGL